MNSCHICGKETSNAVFCSRSCVGKWRGKKNQENQIPSCLECGKPVKRWYLKTCSHVCDAKLKAKDKLTSGKASATVLKTHLIRLHGRKCMECGWDRVNPTLGRCPIELDHIDGNSSNNKPENGRLLCPNCHSLTPTYKWLNRGNGPKSRKAKEII